MYFIHNEIYWEDLRNQLIYFLILSFLGFLETESLVVQAGLEPLTLLSSLPNARMTEMYYHTRFLGLWF